MKEITYDKDTIKAQIEGKIRRYFGCELSSATLNMLYQAVAFVVRDDIMDKWIREKQNRQKRRGKKLYYLSAEFLTGRALDNNISNLVKMDTYVQALNELGLDLPTLEEQESDPGLGNGGLGRLAACFLESLSTLSLPAMGCTIRYEYGLFKQVIVDGFQAELPDSWLENGNPWEVEAPADTVEVHFGGDIEEDWTSGSLKVTHHNYKTVLAVPYDMPVVGYDSPTVNTLRCWSARSPKRIDMGDFARGLYAQSMEERELAEVISKVLYPEDNHLAGKELRLKQYYFFASASVQYIIKRYEEVNGPNLFRLCDKVAIHINDTHPGLAIPEFVRILIDEKEYELKDALSIAERTFGYTNHTVMAEALERWPEKMLAVQLPRIYQILLAMNEIYCKKLWEYYPNDWDRIASMAIIGYGEVRMANLCIAFSHSVNGVSQLHADILRKQTFHDFCEVEPQKFLGITNGVTQRRWLMQANPGLSALITEAIGPAWHKEPERLCDLLPMAKDAAFQKKFAAIKQENKRRLAAFMLKTQDITMDTESIFDVQAKRLHEYKRQLLNVLHIMYLYNRILEDSSFTIAPRTFIFAAKAAPGYARAKLIIRLIHAVAELIENHPRAKKMLHVVFLQNYGVTSAQILIPATEISEQISTAGKEASGTGNMKFMMNGALTIGTMDGANVEMYEQAGAQNIYIFGKTAEEVESLYRTGYRSGEIYEQNIAIRHIMEQLIDGTLAPQIPHVFTDLYQSLLFEGYIPDPYMVLMDFESYVDTQEKVQEEYLRPKLWLKKAIINTAASGFFSSDRTIHEYNDKIWHLTAQKPTQSHTKKA